MCRSFTTSVLNLGPSDWGFDVRIVTGMENTSSVPLSII